MYVVLSMLILQDAIEVSRKISENIFRKCIDRKIGPWQGERTKETTNK